MVNYGCRFFQLSVLLALMSLGGCTSSPYSARLLPPPPDFAEQEKQQALKWKQEEKLWLATANSALDGGSSLLVIPQLAAGVLKEEELKFFADNIVWHSVGNPAVSFNSGARAKNSLRFSINDKAYRILIVAPGTYRVASSTFRAMGNSTRGMSAKSELRESGVGKVTLADAEAYELQDTQEWRDPTFTTETVRTSYCTLAHASGQCLSWANRDQEVQQQSSAGGYYPSTKSVQVSAVDVTASPSRDFASIKVGAGEVLVMDNFMVKSPNADFKQEDCARIAADRIQCVMTNFELQLLRVDPDSVKAGSGIVPSDLPGLRLLLARSVYKPMTIAAKKGWSDPRWGDNYYLR